jgi:hypothetical protein
VSPQPLPCMFSYPNERTFHSTLRRNSQIGLVRTSENDISSTFMEISPYLHESFQKRDLNITRLDMRERN